MARQSLGSSSGQTAGQPTVDEILAAIEANLVSTGGSMVADVSCISNRPLFTFTGGFVAAQDADKFYIDMGTAGIVMWHDAVAYNGTDARVPGARLDARWDDPAPEILPVMFWGYFVGLVDLRVVLSYAESTYAPMTLHTGTVQVNGVECYFLSGDGYRLWVDASALHRVVRCEVDYWPEAGAGLLARTDFDGWSYYGDAELPDTIHTEIYETTGELITERTYMLSNIEVGVPLDPALFEVQDPGYYPWEESQQPEPPAEPDAPASP